MTSLSYRSIVRLAVPSKPSTPAITLEQQWDVDECRLVEHGLDLLGYVPGEVDGVFTGPNSAGDPRVSSGPRCANDRMARGDPAAQARGRRGQGGGKAR